MPRYHAAIVSETLLSRSVIRDRTIEAPDLDAAWKMAGDWIMDLPEALSAVGDHLSLHGGGRAHRSETLEDILLQRALEARGLSGA